MQSLAWVDLTDFCVLYKFMGTHAFDFSKYSEREILSSLQYLVDEGFVEFKELNGEWFLKIAEGVD